MSTVEGQFGVPGGGAEAIDLRSPTRSERTRVAGAVWGQVGLAAVLLSALVVCIGAANTNILLPQTIRPAIGTPLAGPLSNLGLHLGAGEVLAALIVMFAGYAAALRFAERIEPRIVIGAIGALLLIVVMAPPLFSTDVFSYQAYAREFFTIGANPYTSGPHVLQFPSDPLYPFIGAEWVNTPTVYGPLFTLLSGLFPTSSLGAVAFSAFAYKVVAGLSVIGILMLIWRSAKLRGLNPVRAVALVGLNPLVILYGAGGGHNDLLMLLVASGGIWALLTRREGTSGALIVASAAIKLTGGLFLPFAIASEHGLGSGPRRKRVLIGAALSGIACLAVGLALFGTDMFHLTGTLAQVQNEGGWQTVPGLVTLLLPWHTADHVISDVFGLGFVLIFGRLLWRVWKGDLDWLNAAAWAAFWLLVASSQLLPWYLTWMLVPVALCTSPRLWRVAIWFSGWILFSTALQYVPHGLTLIGL